MEFLIIKPRYLNKVKRERHVTQAVLRAADKVEAEKVVIRSSNVYSTGVYLKNEKGKLLLYNDWDKDWNWKKIFANIISSINPSPDFNSNYQDMLTT